ncbi:MAG TPA: GNAT family N-acetyltransferase [Chitinophagales bacterium]|nr:GNAT family N-acetyltransferase [Chitinophagales bacterium]
MNIKVRKAEPRDVAAMLALIKELAVYEKAPDEVITTEESMLRDGFGEEKIFDSLVAEADEVIAGIAIFYIAYSTWKGKMVYLDDLVVTESKRGFGIGKKLFDEVGKIAKETGANQLRWHVLDWNEPAINFYKKYGASLDADWITCKLNREQMVELF